MAGKVQCLMTRRFWDGDIDFLKANVTGDVEFIVPENYSSEGLVRAIQKHTVRIFLGEVPSEEVLNSAQDLELMQIPWNGVESLDFHMLKKYSIAVCNSHSNALSVAELAIGLMFSCIKQIPSHDKALRKGNWRRPGSDDCCFPELLTGKNIVFAGYGSVGQAISRMLSGFGLNVTAVARSEKTVNGVPVYGSGRIKSVLPHADIVFVTVPLTQRTRGLIGTSELEAMPSQSYLINVARAEVIDEESLYMALKHGVIAGAAVDTWYMRPERGVSASPVSRFPFHELNNIVMSPHRGGMARDKLLHLNDVAENLNRYARGDKLLHLVNIKEGY